MCPGNRIINCTTTTFVATGLQCRKGRMNLSFTESYQAISRTRMLLYYGFMRSILSYDLNTPDYAVLQPCVGGYKHLQLEGSSMGLCRLYLTHIMTQGSVFFLMWALKSRSLLQDSSTLVVRASYTMHYPLHALHHTDKCMSDNEFTSFLRHLAAQFCLPPK